MRDGKRRNSEDATILILMDEGRKRVVAIVAGILVARHLKTTEDLFDTRDSPRTRSNGYCCGSVGEARIMLTIDDECAK